MREMPDTSPLEDTDFTAQMQALAMEAEHAKAAPKSAEKRVEPSSPTLALAQLLRPVIVGLESVMKVQGEQSAALQRLEKVIGEPKEMPALDQIPAILAETKGVLENKNSVSRAMFDALHSELKGYKDDFIRESVARPVVRDLISLYDDIRELHRQFADAVMQVGAGPAAAAVERVQKNLEHHVHYILEILERMEARVVPALGGKLDKKTQKVVAREPAATEAEDLMIARSVRPGFIWRERLFRAEEVVVKKWGASEAGAEEA